MAHALGAAADPDTIRGPVNSSYLVMRLSNRCIHRDYQNIAVNGARAASMNESIQESLQRSQARGHPLMYSIRAISQITCCSFVLWASLWSR